MGDSGEVGDGCGVERGVCVRERVWLREKERDGEERGGIEELFYYRSS